MSLPPGGGRAAEGPEEAGAVWRLQAEGREGSTAWAIKRRRRRGRMDRTAAQLPRGGGEHGGWSSRVYV